MPADLTREEIDAMQDRLAVDGDPTHDDMWVLLDYARSEPTRLAAARQEEREKCIRVVRDHIMAVRLGEADGDFRSIASAIEHHIRALAPPPAEPAQPDWPTRCAALEADGIAARKRVAALEAENAKLRERNAALEDGLRPFAAAAGHALEAFGVGKSVTLAVLDRVAAYFVGWTHYKRARALLQGGPDAG